MRQEEYYTGKQQSKQKITWFLWYYVYDIFYLKKQAACKFFCLYFYILQV